MARVSEHEEVASERGTMVLDDELMFVDDQTLVVETSDAAAASVAEPGLEAREEDVIEVGDEVVFDA